MAKTLRDIVETAAQTFPDHFLQRAYEHLAPSDTAELSLTETLAAYVVKEFTELYDPSSSDSANLERIVTSLERSIHVLESTIKQLTVLKLES